MCLWFKFQKSTQEKLQTLNTLFKWIFVCEQHFNFLLFENWIIIPSWRSRNNISYQSTQNLQYKNNFKFYTAVNTCKTSVEFVEKRLISYLRKQRNNIINHTEIHIRLILRKQGFVIRVQTQKLNFNFMNRKHEFNLVSFFFQNKNIRLRKTAILAHPVFTQLVNSFWYRLNKISLVCWRWSGF